jgi:hypothetical protein
VYRLGVGDVLQIDLSNSVKNSGNYSVESTGTIDYPLAGERIVVAGLTTREVEQQLKARIKLFADPVVEVRVKEFNSHTVEVSGLVDNPGIRLLQREAMPMFVIKAEAFVRKEANAVKVTRIAGALPEIYRLGDPAADNVLIHAGNQVEFFASAWLGEYTLTSPMGSVKKELSTGLSLLAAVQAAGQTSFKTVRLKRKGAGGEITQFDYDLRAVQSGKVQNPLLVAADDIEFRK